MNHDELKKEWKVEVARISRSELLCKPTFF